MHKKTFEIAQKLNIQWQKIIIKDVFYFHTCKLSEGKIQNYLAGSSVSVTYFASHNQKSRFQFLISTLHNAI